MTASELALPWGTFALKGYRPWTIAVSRHGREVVLRGDEVLALCAAVELERVHEGTIDELLARRRRDRRPWTRQQLADVHVDAPGELPLSEVLRRVGLEFVRSEVSLPREKESA